MTATKKKRRGKAAAISMQEFGQIVRAISDARKFEGERLFDERLPSPQEKARALWKYTRDILIFRIAWAGGLRVAEVAGLRREDIRDQADGVIRIGYTAKGDKARVLTLPKAEAKKLRRLFDVEPKGEHVFSSDGGGRLSTKTLQRIVKRWLSYWCRASGLPSRRWSFHSIRRGAGTEVYKQFGLYAAQLFLGHASPTTTIIYLALREKDKAEYTTYMIREADAAEHAVKVKERRAAIREAVRKHRKKQKFTGKKKTGNVLPFDGEAVTG